MYTNNIELLECIDKLIKKLTDIKSHYFISKSQSVYLKSIKKNLALDSVIILLDYSENYSFIYQDAIQSVHWDNTQATLNPIVVYINVNGKIIVNSFCIISDHLTHNTLAAHSFIKVVLDYIKVNYVNIKRVIYFSDGASQYENYKNMINLCKYYNDFNLSAE